MEPREFERQYTALVGVVTTSPPEGFKMDPAPPVGVPPALRFVLGWTGQSRLSQAHNHLIEPAVYRPDELGMVEFAFENQGVVSWGYPVESAGDPGVYQRSHDERGDGPWVVDGMSMSEFLLAFAYWNAAHGAADSTAVGEVGPRTRHLLQELEETFTTSDFSVFRSGDAFVIVTDED